MCIRDSIHTLEWDQELLDILNIPKLLLPKVVSCSEEVGTTSKIFFKDSIPISGIAGDQQAALFGQMCINAGDVKNTYGTGCFCIMNTGEKPVQSKNKMLTTIGYQINGKVNYALEGSVFISGAAVQWLRDQLGIISSASEIEALAETVENNGGVTFITAMAGLGAPYWKSEVRGSLYGITRDTSKGDIVKAALKSICFQTKDLLESLKLDLGEEIQDDMTMRVDGGMSNNNWMMQFLADILNIKVERPVNSETTVMGAAYLAGLKVDFFNNFRDIEDLWKSDRVFIPNMDDEERNSMYMSWKKTVNNLIGL